jgi:hypothetical protein
MISVLVRLLAILKTIFSLFKSHRQLALENLALRQQIAMLKSSMKRPKVAPADRLFLDSVREIFERMAVNVTRIESGHRRALAPRRLPTLLAVEKSTPKSG